MESKEESIFECNYCTHSAKNMNSLNQHLSSIHNASQEKLLNLGNYIVGHDPRQEVFLEDDDSAYSSHPSTNYDFAQDESPETKAVQNPKVALLPMSPIKHFDSVYHDKSSTIDDTRELENEDPTFQNSAYGKDDDKSHDARGAPAQKSSLQPLAPIEDGEASHGNTTLANDNVTTDSTEEDTKDDKKQTNGEKAKRKCEL